VTGVVISAYGGAGEDELSRVAPSVNFATNLVPEPRFDLPLVEQAGDSTRQKQDRVHCGELSRIEVYVQYRRREARRP